VIRCLTDTYQQGILVERINVRVGERLLEELEAEAREKGVRPSDIILAYEPEVIYPRSGNRPTIEPMHRRR